MVIVAIYVHQLKLSKNVPIIKTNMFISVRSQKRFNCREFNRTPTVFYVFYRLLRYAMKMFWQKSEM